MYRLRLSCIITTIMLCVNLTAVAQEQQNLSPSDSYEDDPTPDIQDNLPPGANPATLQDDGVTFELNDKAALLTDKTTNKSEEMLPFNSMRIKLIQALQHVPDHVVINGKNIPLHHPERIAQFYQTAGYPTVWTVEHQFNNLLNTLKKIITASADDALNPQHYHAKELLTAHPNVDYNDIIAYELLASDAYLTLLGDLANGLVNPHVTHSSWNAPPVSDDILTTLFAKAIDKHDLVGTVKRINAASPRYQALKKAYNTLRHSAPANNAIHQKELANLMINMERLRWLPQTLGKSYILVNIPDFRVIMYRNGRPIYESRAVVGRKDRPTPAFINHLKHIVMSPTWTVPPTIMEQDKLPRLRRNPNAFDSAFEVVTPSGKVVAPSSINWANGAQGYTLRQKSGPNNALGRVKFLFPNKHAIYIHDTPSKNLFNRTNRAYSSGCIRVQKPLELADLLLAGTQWTPENIEQATRQTRERWVDPPQGVPVYIVYWTAWADPSGKMHKASDIYSLDKTLLDQYSTALTHP